MKKCAAPLAISVAVKACSETLFIPNPTHPKP